MDFKKLLYKTLVKYYLSNKVKAPFEDFALGLQIVRLALLLCYNLGPHPFTKSKFQSTKNYTLFHQNALHLCL